MDELTHASFFSGVGGLDLGLERAGWRTVSFSEIDPYASAALEQRWPGVPNLGDIVQLASRFGGGAVNEPRDGSGTQHQPDPGDLANGRRVGQQRESTGHLGPAGASDDQQLVGWDAASRADLWTGGFPCQDLSVAGKRRGMVVGSRSGLAFAFLDLVERCRPPFVVLENVPGLLSSHGGRDMGALCGRLEELGYVGAYRTLDARYFGVPQRRRRVFIVGIHSRLGFGAERAAEVLSVGSVCQRHPPTGRDTGAESPRAVARRAVSAGELVGTLDGGFGHHGGAIGGDNLRQGHVIATDPADHAGGQAGGRQGTTVVGGREPDPGHGERSDAVRWADGATPDPGGVRTADGLAGGLDDRGGLAATLNSGGNNGGFRTEPGEHLTIGTLREHVRPGSNTDHSIVQAFTKSHNATGIDDAETWAGANEARNVNGFDGDRTTLVTGAVADDPLLPLGLDSHRYRCCGNGVVSDVSEWIGHRLAEIAMTDSRGVSEGSDTDDWLANDAVRVFPDARTAVPLEPKP